MFATGILIDIALVAAVFCVIVVVDIVPEVRKRTSAGGEGLRLSDFAQRKHVLVLAPLALLIILQQNIFAWLGFDVRDDVPYFLGFLLAITLAAVLLVWWLRTED